MTHRISRIVASVALAGMAASALAQQPAAAPAGPTPKHSCAKPGDFPGGLASDNQRKNWQKGSVEYVDCLKKFINEQGIQRADRESQGQLSAAQRRRPRA